MIGQYSSWQEIDLTTLQLTRTGSRQNKFEQIVVVN